MRRATKSSNGYPPMPSLILKRMDGTEKAVELSSKPVIIGRVPESDIPVRDSFVSRVHCGISFVNNQFTLKDLGSTNGTYRNGARVFSCTLATGEKIQVGNTTLLFEVDPTTGNGLLRQLPQVALPPLAAPVSVPPRPL